MDDRSAIALVALSLVEGVARSDIQADSMLTDAFADLNEAARAHAYLAGFLIELLAHERREPVAVTASTVRRLLETKG